MILKILLSFLLITSSATLLSLEPYEKLSIKILNQFDQKQVRVDRGLEDDLRKGEGVRFVQDEKPKAKGIVIFATPSESIISIYRHLNGTFDVGQSYQITRLAHIDITEEERSNLLLKVKVDKSFSALVKPVNEVVDDERESNPEKILLNAIEDASPLITQYDQEDDESIALVDKKKSLSFGVSPFSISRNMGANSKQKSNIAAKTQYSQTGLTAYSLAYRYLQQVESKDEYRKQHEVRSDFSIRKGMRYAGSAVFKQASKSEYDDKQKKFEKINGTLFRGVFEIDLLRVKRSFSLFSSLSYDLDQKFYHQHSDSWKLSSFGFLGVKYYLYEEKKSGDELDISWIPLIEKFQREYQVQGVKKLSGTTDLRHSIRGKGSLSFFSSKLKLSETVSWQPRHAISSALIDGSDVRIAHQFDLKAQIRENFYFNYSNSLAYDSRTKSEEGDPPLAYDHDLSLSFEKSF